MNSSQMKNWCRSIVRRALDDFDLYCTLIAAVALSILGLLNLITQTAVESIIPAVLALVCLSLLRSRRQSDQVTMALDGLTDSQSLANRFFVEVDNMEAVRSRILAAREVWMQGATLRIHIPALTETLRDAVANGLRVKLLLLQPSSSAMEMAAFQDGNTTCEQLSRTLEVNLAQLARPISTNVYGRLEIRLINYLPAGAIYIYDPNGKDGQMEMRLTSFHGNHWLRPTFQMTYARDRKWYEYFRSQFVEIWEAATVYTELP